MMTDPVLTPVRLDGIPLFLHPKVSGVSRELLCGRRRVYHRFPITDPTILYWLRHVKRIIGDEREKEVVVRLILSPSTTHDYILPYLQNSGTRMTLVFRKVTMDEMIEKVFCLRQLNLVGDVRLLIALKML